MLNSKKLALANSQLTTLTAQITGAGFKVEDFISEDAAPTALKDAIASKVDASATSAESVIKEIFGEAIETHDLDTAKGHLKDISADAAEAESLQSQVTAFESGIKAAGVKLAIEEGATITADSVEKAVSGRVSILAREKLASHSIKTADTPEVKVTADATSPEKKPENRRNSHAVASLKKIGFDD